MLKFELLASVFPRWQWFGNNTGLPIALWQATKVARTVFLAIFTNAKVYVVGLNNIRCACINRN